MTYTPVGWANDETHPLSQANMKTLDKGIADVANVVIYDEAVTTANTGTITIPSGFSQLVIDVSRRHDGTVAGLREVLLRWNGRTADYISAVHHITGTTVAEHTRTSHAVLGWLPEGVTNSGAMRAIMPHAGAAIRQVVHTGGWARQGTDYRTWTGGAVNTDAAAPLPVESLILDVDATNFDATRIRITGVR